MMLTHLIQPATVYPRVCGGTELAEEAWLYDLGLSPRVRGNPLRQAALATAHRSIPACAGEPTTPPALPPGCWVYPRVCGGTTAVLQRGNAPGGLSPRVRGNHGCHALR